ncbi:PREDICTED: receptor-like kinase TMK4 [Ipomoea nil]|uniref:receptor-like kinase TMK4 n=1 Tax=Ipomoea nil TaxID=35883 RepID=UPI000900F3E4|nr:PREDICTED: receptor-like kinase TMK4 [Ipomoea nil]
MAYAKALFFFFRLLLLINLLTVSFCDDAAVMAKLLAALSPTPSGWSTSADYCAWDYVACQSGNVYIISLASQSISGELPSELTQLASLRSLSVQQNSLSGPLPSFANMSSLEELYLDSNEFSSIPQDFLLGLPNLGTFNISDNDKLSPWQIPSYLAESTYLGSFCASNASIIGAIPNFFNSFPNLRNLGLSYNNLAGSLPASFGSSEIQNLWLNNQQQGLSGTIDVLSSMTQLSQVWLHANAFTGPIPDLSKCVNLFDLQLRDNQLTGVVPVSITGLPKLVNITLQHNTLQGPMPEFGNNVKKNLGNGFCNDKPGPCDPQVTALLAVAGDLGYPITLVQSWHGNNACNNWAPISCDAQGNVISLTLRKQGFSGTISPALANLTSLRNLYLNDNNLTGPIPESLTTLPNLQELEVSNNNLSGPIPVFPPSVIFSHGGNLFLGKNVSIGGSPSSGQNSDALIPSDNPLSGNSNGSSISGGMIVGVVIAVVIVVVVVFFVSYKCYMKRQHKMKVNVNGTTVSIEIKKRDIVDYGRTFPALEDGNISIPIQVLQKATNFFSHENVLGSGGYGVVYLGKLDDGTKVAVKKMKDGAMHTKGMNEFQAEIAFLTKVRHRNLVALIGYCINDNNRLLVYEYMSQGTLGHHLFEWEKHGFDPLSWKQRVSIALDVARGIEYLHSFAHQNFIHRDIKSSNILLSDDMRAKVADFGLVRKAPNDKSSFETRVAGTFGYLAPEYATTGRATNKVDVYAFGVVLMEIITGKKAVDETLPDETCHLVTWFHKIIRRGHNLRNAIDPTLDLDDQTFESVSKVAELAAHCTANKYFRRPNTEHVVNVLGPFAHKWKPLRPEEIEEKYGGLDLHMSLPLAFHDSSIDESLSFTEAQLNGHRLNQSAQF